MLNSEQLADLKIDALAASSTNQNRHYYFADFTTAFAAPCNDQVIISRSNNSNILAFAFILLSHIFESRGMRSHPNSSNSSPSSDLNNNGSGSMSLERGASAANTAKVKEKDQSSQSVQKLKKIYQHLLSNKINFTEIINIPANIQQALDSSTSDKNNQNSYMKKLLTEFLKKLAEAQTQSQVNVSPRSQSKFQQSGYKKQMIVISQLNRYPVAQFLLQVYIRCILFSVYEISQAQDYSRKISDHTVYTALCDAFQYASLHIEQKYTEITSGMLIRLLRMKKRRGINQDQDIQYYAVTLPQNRSEHPIKEGNQCSDTFRVRKKSSDVSNTQTISFRQSPKIAQPQVTQTIIQDVQQHQPTKSKSAVSLHVEQQILNNQERITNQAQTSNKNPEQSVVQSSTRNNSKQELKNSRDNNAIMKTSATLNYHETNIYVKPSTEQAIPKQMQKKTDKMFSHSFFPRSTEHKYVTNTSNLNGYTSLEILKELSPKVRDHMVETIGYFKKYRL